jgi:uncharacterized Zn-binding protein involved in type VI secretion
MPAAARLTDTTAHGGKIIWGEPTVLIGGLPAARLGDPHVCPMSNGPVVHNGGVVTSGSATVIIGGAAAARLGDRCDCQTVGAAGVGVPQQVGPGLNDETMAYNDRDTQGWQGPGGSIRYRDTDQDGTYDTLEGEGSALRHNYQDSVDANGEHLEIQNTLDIGFADGAETARGNNGYTLQQRLDAGVVRDRGSVRWGQQNPNNSPFTNPFISLSWDARALSGAEETGALIGDDGVRTGLGNEGHGAANPVSGELTLETNLPFLPRSASGGLSLGPGGGLDEHIYYDRRDGQVHLVLGGEYTYYGGSLDIPLNPAMDQIEMIGNRMQRIINLISGGSGSPGPPPVIPNTIISGDPTVLIGD